MASNYWIVTSFNFCRHGSFAAARAELARLTAAMDPDKARRFRIIRCKTDPNPSDARLEGARAMLADISRRLAAGCRPASIEDFDGIDPETVIAALEAPASPSRQERT